MFGIPGWLWVVLSGLVLCVVIALAAVTLVRNKPPWDGDDLD
jgi:hypothetical protein